MYNTTVMPSVLADLLALALLLCAALYPAQKGRPDEVFATGFETPAELGNMIVDRPSPGKETKTLPLDRPVLYRRGRPEAQ